MTHSSHHTPLRGLGLACATVLALAGCSAEQAPAGPGSSTTGGGATSGAADPVDSVGSGQATSAGTVSAAGLTVSDAWVKAAPTLAPDAMSAAFGTIANTTGKDITVASATQDASEVTELHETVTVDGKKAMRAKSGGFTIKAGGRLELKPGGDHIMLMKMTRALPLGARVAFTLTLSDGQVVTFSAPAKQFTSPPENYVPGPGGAGASGTTGMPGAGTPALPATSASPAGPATPDGPVPTASHS